MRDLAAWLAIWQARQEPDAVARRHASDAVDAIDAMLADLHQVRAGWAQRALASLRWHWSTAYIISWPAPGTWLAQRRDTRETLRADSAEAH